MRENDIIRLLRARGGRGKKNTIIFVSVGTPHMDIMFLFANSRNTKTQARKTGPPTQLESAEQRLERVADRRRRRRERRVEVRRDRRPRLQHSALDRCAGQVRQPAGPVGRGSRVIDHNPAIGSACEYIHKRIIVMKIERQAQIYKYTAANKKSDVTTHPSTPYLTMAPIASTTILSASPGLEASESVYTSCRDEPCGMTQE
jgi:hypothetical protein